MLCVLSFIKNIHFLYADNEHKAVKFANFLKTRQLEIQNIEILKSVDRKHTVMRLVHICLILVAFLRTEKMKIAAHPTQHRTKEGLANRAPTVVSAG